jgi:hypothetical protein
LGFIAGATAGSINNCADSSAHLKSFEATISPDPPVKGQDVTMTFKGSMDEDTDKGTVIISAAAGPISIPSMKIPFDISPTIPHGGEVNLQVGPFQYPDISVPLLSSITSHMEMHDKNDEMVMCVDTTLPAAQEATFLQAPVKASPPFVSCAGSGAHIKNGGVDVSPAQPQKGKDVTITFTGDLDETISSGVVELDINLVIFTLSMKIPFKLAEQGVPATNSVKAVIGPFTLPNIPLIPNVKGSVKVSEQNGEEVTCTNFNMPIADAIEV